MSTMVLLKGDGTVSKRIHFVSLPDNFVVPEGMTISWRWDVRVSSHDALSKFLPLEPLEAYFYLGSARGQVCRGDVNPNDSGDRFGPREYCARTLTVTVQGTVPREVMLLRDHIMHLINTGRSWGVSNDLNPKTKAERLRQRLLGK